MHVTPLNPEAFCRSIEIALRNPPDIEGSLERIRKSLNRLPDGRLYVSDQAKRVTFFTEEDGKQKYLSKKTDQFYSLARRKYQTMLFKILSLTESTKKKDIAHRNALIAKLQTFIRTCAKGHIEIERIVLTNAQYQWFTGQFRQKYIDPDSPFKTANGLPVRSKSERDILNGYDDLAVPIHYEEQMVIDVQYLVDKLEKTLLAQGALKGLLFICDSYETHWNVPPQFQWMNSIGSIWKTYDPRHGTLSIFNDFRGMFADSSLFIHEHEGMMEDFIYRCNSSERASVIKYTGTVDKKNFIETYEHEVDTPEKVIDIIERLVLPRLWF